MGPCALEYTKLKTADHYWTDPSADELVQRHRIRGPPNRQDSPAKRPALGVGIPLPTPHTYPGYAHEPVWKGSLASIFFADAIWPLEMHQGVLPQESLLSTLAHINARSTPMVHGWREEGGQEQTQDRVDPWVS